MSGPRLASWPSLLIAAIVITSGVVAWSYADISRALWTRIHYSHEGQIVDVSQFHPLTPIGAGQRYAVRPPGPSHRNAGDFEPVRDIATRTSSNIVVINRAGELLFEAYHAQPGADALMLTNSMSMAKSLVALLVGIAIDRGAMRSVDQAIADFLPELAGDPRGRITIRQLLRMESGLQSQNAGFPLSHLQKMYFGPQPHAAALKVPMVREPGAHFEYNSVNTQLLVLAVERALGAGFEDLLTRHIWQPLGLDAGFAWRASAGGQPKGFCCVFATARSWAEIGRLFLGDQPGRSVVPSSWLSEMVRPGARAQYGYHVWLGTVEDGRPPFVSLEGSPQQFVFVFPTVGVAAVRVGRETPAFSTDEFLSALMPLRE